MWLAPIAEEMSQATGTLFVVLTNNPRLTPTPDRKPDLSSGALPSFLAYNRELETRSTGALSECPKQGWVLLDEASGAIIRPAPCDNNRCPIHGPRKAYATAVAVDKVGPQRFVLLTDLAETHEGRREQRKTFRQNLRRLGYRYECWGVTERTKAGVPHGHEWQTGDFIPVETIRRAAIGAGMGSWVGMRKWEQRAGGGLGTLYGVKAIAKAGALYGVKGVAGSGLDGFLEDNGGRYGYWTRGFFGQGYRDARREAMSDVYRSENGVWSLMRDPAALRG